ncbi:MAG: ABC-type branched-chain amino acid transport system, periplasmic component, partial [Proteobacteria bacterium]|nr:ABC-type branched-chain amino acid transport system, periplasmic component [Pseudomonadota bacterium]
TFKTTQTDELLAEKLIVHMQWNRVNSLGFIGFNDSYGKKWHKIINKQASKAFIDITASMGFDRTDASVSEQVARIISTRPDAVLVAASGEPALVPQFALREKGYKGLIYQTHGVASSEFIRLGGKRVEGVLVASDPVLVADELSKGNPVKLVAQAYVQNYEERFGTGSASAYGARIFDAGLLLQNAIPRALKKAVPGTLQFRQALRDELEQIRELTGTQGVFRMSPLDHNGMDRRSCVIMKVQDGRWVLVK